MDTDTFRVNIKSRNDYKDVASDAETRNCEVNSLLTKGKNKKN